MDAFLHSACTLALKISAGKDRSQAKSPDLALIVSESFYAQVSLVRVTQALQRIFSADTDNLSDLHVQLRSRRCIRLFCHWHSGQGSSAVAT